MSETQSNRAFWVGVAVAVAATLLLFFWPRVAEELRPQPRRAHVAIEGDDGVARSASINVEYGTEVTLHAVLEAETAGGESIYYTEAAALEIDDQRISPERLRPWDRPEGLAVLWFTVEGKVPYVPISDEGSLDEWQFEEFFRADWPRTWSIRADVTSRHGVHLPRSEADRERSFGVQRYHVRLELRQPDRPAYVQERYRSVGADSVFELGDRFPTLSVELPGPLARASSVFGLSQLEPVGDLPPSALERLVALSANHFAFSRATLFRDILRDRGRTLDQLPWQIVTLGADALRWSDEVSAGDFVRVGGRVTVLFQDRGLPDQLDDQDLCFDFERGTRIRSLAEVFTEGARVEWAGQR